MKSLLFCFALLLSSLSQAAVPSHFGDKMQAALLCRSEWSTSYWRGYFRQYLGQPLRSWGGAEWFKAEGGEVAGSPVLETFVNQTDTTALMVGVLINMPADKVKKNIEDRLGVSFMPIADGRFLSRTGSVLVPVPDRDQPKTKWYCARWNLGNRP